MGLVGLNVGVIVEQIDRPTFDGQLPSAQEQCPSNKGHELSSQRPGEHVPHGVQYPPAGQSSKVGDSVGTFVGIFIHSYKFVGHGPPSVG